MDVWLSLLVEQLCLRRPLLRSLLLRLQGGPRGADAASAGAADSLELAGLLWVLWHALQMKAEAEVAGDTVEPSSALTGSDGIDSKVAVTNVCLLVNTLSHLAPLLPPHPSTAHTVTASRATSCRADDSCSEGTPTATPTLAPTAVLLLRCCLHCLRLLFAVELRGRQSKGEGNGQRGREGEREDREDDEELRISGAAALSEVGRSQVIPLLLSMLYALGPPRHMDLKINDVTDGERGASSRKATSVLPYHGYRRDLVAVIGNCCFRRPTCQDAVREWALGTETSEAKACTGLILMLQQCVNDEKNPNLREWALLAMRNLLEGNEENRIAVSALEVRGVVQDPLLQAAGLEVALNRNNGKLIVSNNKQFVNDS